jgi:uncharacterized protein YjdB
MLSDVLKVVRAHGQFSGKAILLALAVAVASLACGRSALGVLGANDGGRGTLLGSGARTLPEAGVLDPRDAASADVAPSDVATGAPDAGTPLGAGDAGAAVALLGLEVAPPVATVGVGGTIELMAVGRYADGSRRDVTAQVAWTAQPPNLLAFTGLVGRALAVGEAQVTATLAGQRAVARVRITTAKLLSVDVEPSEARMAAGFKLPLRAFALYDDGGRVEVTSQASWTSSDVALASVLSGGASPGLVSGLRPGKVAITAVYMGHVGRASLDVTPAPLQRLEVTPALPKLPARSMIAFRATGIFSDGTTEDLSSQVTWGSDAPAILAFPLAALPGTAIALTSGTALVSARAGTVAGATVAVVVAPVVMSLALAPPVAMLPRGHTQAFKLTATFPDGTTADVTAQATWTASDPALLAIGNGPGREGVATALAPGQVRVLAALAGVTASAPVTILPAALVRLVLRPTTATLPVGGAAPFSVTGTYGDGSERDVTELASFTVGDGRVASASNLPGQVGRVRALGPGSTEVRAALDGQAATATLTVTGARLVSVAIEPAMAMVQVGRQQMFRATAAFDDGGRLDVTDQAMWLTDDTKVAAISNAPSSRGVLTALAPGKTTVRARFEAAGETREGTAALIVGDDELAGIRITPQTPTLHLGETATFVTSAVYANGATRPLVMGVTFTSSNPALVTVTATGVARCVTAGSVTITANAMNRMDSTAVVCADPTVVDLQVLPFAGAILVGQVQQFQAVAVFSDLSTRDVTALADWSTANPAVAIVANTTGRGRATGTGAGVVRVSAAYRGQSAGALLTVSDARLVGLSVAPALARIRVMQAVQFVASGLYSDGVVRPLTAVCTWSSSNDAIADVNNAGARGRAMGFAPGTVTITASAMGFSDAVTLTVVAGKVVELQVAPVQATLVLGQRLQYQGIAIYDDGANQNVTAQVTWQSSDDKVADVSNGVGRGQATALGTGAVVVTGSYMGTLAMANLTVTSARLTELQVTPVQATIPKGQRRQYQAIGIYSDGSSRNLTGQATWTSSNRAVAAVSTAGGSAGQVTALAAGGAQIVAAMGGFMGRAGLTVTAATLTEIQITPPSPVLPPGIEQQLHAVGVYSDGSSRTLTGQVTWNSSNEAVAAVSNAAAKGTLAAVSPGSVTITATLDDKTGTATATISSATLKELQITPASLTLPRGLSQQLSAVGIYSDGSHRTLTSVVTWNSSNEAIAAVSNVGGRGVATAVAPGTVTVTAAFMGVTGQARLGVSDAVVTEVQLSPANPGVPKGLSQAFVAMAVYSDGSVRNVTGLATWASAEPAVATVSNAPGTAGRAYALTEGASKISAAFGGKTGASTLRVTAATVTRVEIVPARLKLPVGARGPLVATAILSDGTTLPATDLATWSSGAPAVAVISNAPGSQGTASALAVGTTTVTATVLGVGGTAELTVTSARLASISVRPERPSVAVDVRAQLTATGAYDDGSTFDLTNLATWTSSAPAVAAVSNVDGTRGQVTGLAAGTASIEAHIGTVSARAQLSVTR